MKKCLTVTVALLVYALMLSSLPSRRSCPPELRVESQESDNLFVLNAPLMIVHFQDGSEIKAANESFFFGGTAAEFAAVGLDTTDLKLVDAIKASGGDTNLDISPDRKNAHLKDGQTVYYGVKILPASRGEVTGVTFVLTTVPISGVPDIVNNFFKIRYVESVGGRAGDIKNDSTSGKAYQVITPAGEHLYYFSFTAVAKSGGIRTTIQPHFFGGAIVRDVAQDYIQCCCAHTKKPLPRVPEITYCWWYGFPYISDWFTYWFKVCLAKAVATNTANVPCDHQAEAQGKEITITGDGFSRLNKSKEELAGLIKITDDCGTVATVTEVTSLTNTEIKAKIDITACRPGTKTVKIEGAGGFATTTFIKVIQDVPDTIVGQKRFQAVRIIGTQEKIPLTITIDDGTNIIFSQDQRFNVTCVTRNSPTTATTTTTGGCNNIATTTIQGTTIPGEDNIIVTGDGIRCTAPIRNADINLTADVPEDKETTLGVFLCVGETKPLTLTVSSPSTYLYKVTLSMKTTPGSSSVIQVFDSEGAPILTGDGTTTLFSGKGSTDITKNLTVKGTSPGTACLTATYYDCTWKKCDTVKFTVMSLIALKVEESGNLANFKEDREDGEPNPLLVVCETANKNSKVILTATTFPATGEMMRKVRFSIEGETANPSVGKFDPEIATEITLTPTNGNRRYTITAWFDCNDDGKLDKGEVTRVVEVTLEENAIIVVASDFMVPQSMKNVVRYKWPNGISPDSATMEVYDKDGTKIRTLTGLPIIYVEGKDYAEFFWNACKDQYGSGPLTEDKSPYKIVIVLKDGETQCHAVVDERKVKEWEFRFVVPDREPSVGQGRSGVDKDTITPDKVITKVQVTGGTENAIAHYNVDFVDDGGNAYIGGKNSAVILKSGAGPKEYYLIYTTPTTPTDVTVTYTVKVTSMTGGALDKAENEWDMDKSAAGTQRNVRWDFKVDAQGGFVKPQGGAGYDEIITD